MIRLILGLIKGLIVGGAAAYGALTLGLVTSFFTMIACILTGAVVGVVAGKAPWRAETLWTPAVKATDCPRARTNVARASCVVPSGSLPS